MTYQSSDNTDLEQTDELSTASSASASSSTADGLLLPSGLAEISEELLEDDDDDNSRHPSASDDDIDDSFHSKGKGGSNGNKTNHKKNDQDQLAQKETAHVFRLRVAVFICLAAAAAAVSTVVFIISRNAEEDEFNVQFNSAALKVIDSFHSIIGEKVDALGSLGIAYTATGRAVTDHQDSDNSGNHMSNNGNHSNSDSNSHDSNSGNSWPTVNMRDFAPRATATRLNSASLFIGLLPIVNETMRPAWEHYASQNLDFIQEGLHFQEAQQAMMKESAKNSHGNHGGHGGGHGDDDDDDDSNSHHQHQETTTGGHGSSHEHRLLHGASKDEDEDEKHGKDGDMDEMDNMKHDNKHENNIMKGGQVCNKDTSGLPPMNFTHHHDLNDRMIATGIYDCTCDAKPVKAAPADYYAPAWQTSPIVQRDWVNFNFLDYDAYAQYIRISYELGEVVFGGLDVAKSGHADDPDLTTSFFASILSFKAGQDVMYTGEPMSSIYYPIFDSYDFDKRTPVAVLLSVISWSDYLQGILPPGTKGVMVVLENTCDGAFTYVIDGPNVSYLGPGDQHDSSYDSMAVVDDHLVHDFDSGLKLNEDGECSYEIRVYPTNSFANDYNTRDPIVFTIAVALVFVFTALLFLVYDYLVERRQRLVMKRAIHSTAIVSSLFPAAVRDKMLEHPDDHTERADAGKSFRSANKKLSSYLQQDEDHTDFFDDKPLADFFPHCTVLFADIAGFTAWSSSREPAQVFILLQTIYQSFDTLAKRYRVFKIETIGDSYVAVTGLPEPQKKHAVLMARFAQACMEKMAELVKRLEVSLGPDTGDLTMRFGLNSGPVTAGVLKGERARFQLFGDTVNTASRMESTGMRNRIHASQSTVDLLTNAGKAHWALKREDKVIAKGKGELQTYWLNPRSRNSESVLSSGYGGDDDCSEGGLQRTASMLAFLSAEKMTKRLEKQERLIGWNVQLLLSHLRDVVSHRRGLVSQTQSAEDLIYRADRGTTVLEEVKEVITLPKFNPKSLATLPSSTSLDSDSVGISDKVEGQLRNYVSIIASMYHDNAFHNFEHASHVCMTVDKFMKRITSPDIDLAHCEDVQEVASQLHAYTSGITSDPLTLLAVVFSALIHDCNHKGISNGQLIKEDRYLAKKYQNKSVAEQNSVDLAWELLMAPDFGELRQAMFGTKEEMLRFRQVVVNVVLATDIFDKELNDLRKNRWTKVFASNTSNGDEENRNGRATIVIEHIIQASDVGHTMQHWHIYRKWNERLFEEMYSAYKSGRMAQDPSTFWVTGELKFFDNYVIPLAKKLEECQVFGVSSDECLINAMNNRKEWETKGPQCLAEMVEKYTVSFVDDTTFGTDDDPLVITESSRAAPKSSLGIHREEPIEEFENE